MTYLNKGQFYPITLREIDNKGLQQPITKVRVRQKMEKPEEIRWRLIYELRDLVCLLVL